MTDSPNSILLYVTCADEQEAKLIATNLLEQRLIACANILGNIQSLYRWEDTIERSQECVMILKTTTEQSTKAQQAISSIHSYECPCVIEIPISGGYPPFLKWLQEQTRPK